MSMQITALHLLVPAEPFFLSAAATGFAVAFAHAAIPTHWLPFVLAGRGQRWSRAKTLAVVAICGIGHVSFTTLLGVLVVWFGIETSRWTGDVFPWIAGGALAAFGLYYLARQILGGGHGHSQGCHSHSHGGHGRNHGGHHHGGHGHRQAASADGVQSDRAAILGLFTLLTFSPCEGFLPVYLSGIAYGWSGFVVLTSVLAVATVAGMVAFTWLTLSGLAQLRLEFLERYESGILGALILFLGAGIVLWGF